VDSELSFPFALRLADDTILACSIATANFGSVGRFCEQQRLRHRITHWPKSRESSE
jgi:hypothetical protein